MWRLEWGGANFPLPMPLPAQQCWGLMRGGSRSPKRSRTSSLIRGGASSPVPTDINMASGGRPNLGHLGLGGDAGLRY